MINALLKSLKLIEMEKTKVSGSVLTNLTILTNLGWLYGSQKWLDWLGYSDWEIGRNREPKSTSVSFSVCITLSLCYVGTVRSSAPRQFFEDSNVTLYKDMLLYMTQHNTFINQTDMGITKVNVYTVL